MYEMERSKRHYFGEDPGPAHPFVEALRNAREGELEHLVPTQGTIIGHLVGEDEISAVRGSAPTRQSWRAARAYTSSGASPTIAA